MAALGSLAYLSCVMYIYPNVGLVMMLCKIYLEVGIMNNNYVIMMTCISMHPVLEGTGPMYSSV